MGFIKHEITQIFLSVCDPQTEELDASELVARVRKERPEWFSENIEYFAEMGLTQAARSFCKRWDDSAIDDQYLLNFPDLENWEKEEAKRFQNKNAFLPGDGVYKEVCAMTPSEKIKAGQYGVQIGEETVARFKILIAWGVRGGGQWSAGPSIA